MEKMISLLSVMAPSMVDVKRDDGLVGACLMALMLWITDRMV